MSFFQAAVYGLIQGLTEFLPVSSSAHLVLLPVFTGWPDPGLAFDVALHWGTLIAVTSYFRRDLVLFARGAIENIRGRPSADGRLAWQVALATIPGAVLGFVFEDQAKTVLRSPWVIVFTLTLLGLVLLWADRKRSGRFSLHDLSWASALGIGISQGVAIVPGVSRSGITITLGLLLGLARPDAVRFSFLLSIPIIFGAGLLESPFLLQNIRDPIMWTGIASSALFGFAAIHFLITYVKSKSFLPFVIYRFLLALAVVVWLIRP